VVTNVPKHHLVNVAYLGFIALVSVLMALFVVIIGSSFLKILNKSLRISPKAIIRRKAVIRLTIPVLVTFPPMFITKSVLLVWSAAANGTVPIIVFTLLELIPSFVLLNYILPIGKPLDSNLKDSNSSGRPTPANSKSTDLTEGAGSKGVAGKSKGTKRESSAATVSSSVQVVTNSSETTVVSNYTVDADSNANFPSKNE
jgi:hypothetical protein